MFIATGIETIVCFVGARSCFAISNSFAMRRGSWVSPPHLFNVEFDLDIQHWLGHGGINRPQEDNTVSTKLNGH